MRTIINCSIFFLLALCSCSDNSDDYNTILEYKTGLNLKSIKSYKMISAYDYSPNNVQDFYLITSFDELQDFQSSLFDVAIDISADYFNSNILVIHPKATYDGPIEDLHVSIEGDKIIVRYNWEDGGADCPCYVLIVIYISINK